MVLSISRSYPISVPTAMGEEQTSSYKEIIRQLAAQAPKPYGAIPPMPKKRKKKTKRAIKTTDDQPSLVPSSDQQKPMRRMSHVENWIAVDSKESLPDEEELVSSPLRFFSTDILTQVLPLHMPPPSLAATARQKTTIGIPEEGVPIPVTGHQVQTLDDDTLDDEDDNDNDNDENGGTRQWLRPNWRSDGEEEDETDDEETRTQPSGNGHPTLVRRHSISSFSKAQTPSTSTITSYVLSSSPPQHSDVHQVRWMQTIVQLRRSLVLSSSPPNPSADSSKTKRTDFIPMPPAPRRPLSRRRRSEATTQPRFNPDTNTYTRDTRSNPDHLRMISAELNMMRSRKLLSPLKPRGFLPRRKDLFVRGENRRESRLRYEL